MSRVTSALSEKCTRALATLVQIGSPEATDKLTFNSSLKYLILSDPSLSVEIDSANKFEVSELQDANPVTDSPAIASARISDYFMGAARVKKQYDAVTCMKREGESSAWLLVSAYYCAYFAAIEIGKLFNRIALSFEDEDVTALAGKATGPGILAMRDGGASNFVGELRADKLIFRSVGTKPHVAAWANVNSVFKEVFAKLSWTEVNHFSTVFTEPAYSPSRIRNTWNYKRSDFYGDAGERRAQNFKKLVGNSEGAANWFSQRGGTFEDLDPAIIAVLCETLASAVIDSAARAKHIIRVQSAS